MLVGAEVGKVNARTSSGCAGRAVLEVVSVTAGEFMVIRTLEPGGATPNCVVGNVGEACALDWKMTSPDTYLSGCSSSAELALKLFVVSSFHATIQRMRRMPLRPASRISFLGGSKPLAKIITEVSVSKIIEPIPTNIPQIDIIFIEIPHIHGGYCKPFHHAPLSTSYPPIADWHIQYLPL